MRPLEGLSDELVEILQGFRLGQGYSVLLNIVHDKSSSLILQSAHARDREITNGNVVTKERAVETLQRNQGFIDGMEFVLAVFDLADRQRKES